VKEKVDFSGFYDEYMAYLSQCVFSEGVEENEELKRECEFRRKDVDRKLSYADGELVSLLLETVEWLNRFVPSYTVEAEWFNELISQFVCPGVGYYVGLGGERRSTIRFRSFDNGARFIINKLYREKGVLYWFLAFTEEKGKVVIGGSWHGITPHHPGIRATRVSLWEVPVESRSFSVSYDVERWGKVDEGLELAGRELFCSVLAFYGEKGLFPQSFEDLSTYLLFLPKEVEVEVLSREDEVEVRATDGEGGVSFVFGEGGKNRSFVNSVELVDRLYSYGTDLILLSLSETGERNFASLPGMLGALGRAGGLFDGVPFSGLTLAYGVDEGEDGIHVFPREDGSLGGFSIKFGSFRYVVEVP
jgi:hypothetical protein